MNQLITDSTASLLKEANVTTQKNLHAFQKLIDTGTVGLLTSEQRHSAANDLFKLETVLLQFQSTILLLDKTRRNFRHALSL